MAASPRKLQKKESERDGMAQERRLMANTSEYKRGGVDCYLTYYYYCQARDHNNTAGMGMGYAWAMYSVEYGASVRVLYVGMGSRSDGSQAPWYYWWSL